MPRNFTMFVLYALFFVLPINQQARAEAPSFAKKTAELMVTEAKFFALMKAKEDEVFDLIKSRLKKHLSTVQVSDRDLRTLIAMMHEKSAESLVVGLRRAFQKRIESDLSSSDQEIFYHCVKKIRCERDKFSQSAIQSLRGFAQFGKEQGEQIGRLIGAAMNSQLLDDVKGPRRRDFNEPTQVIKMLQLGIVAQ